MCPVDGVIVLRGHVHGIRKFFGIVDSPRPHFTQPISTVYPQNWPILEPPSPLERDVIYGWSLREMRLNSHVELFEKAH